MLLDYPNSTDLICESKKSRLLEEGDVLVFDFLFPSMLTVPVERRVVRSKFTGQNVELV